MGDCGYSNRSSSGSVVCSAAGSGLAWPKVGKVAASIRSSSCDWASIHDMEPVTTCLARPLTLARSSLLVYSFAFSQKVVALAIEEPLLLGALLLTVVPLAALPLALAAAKARRLPSPMTETYQPKAQVHENQRR